MATLQQVKAGMSEAWENLMEGWRRLHQQASGAITRFRSHHRAGAESTAAASREIAVRSAGWGVLACEVFDDDDRVVVRMEAPGMDKDDFDIQVVDDYLVVRGEKQMERERTEGGYHITECAYGSFERAIPLPEQVDTSQAAAKYKRGVLRVELPKTAGRRHRRITIDTSQSS